jgi:hypothetical protein
MKWFSSLSVVFSILISQSFGAIQINVPFDVTVLNSRGVTEFTIPAEFSDPGQPALPGFRCSVLLPPDADLSKISYSLDGLVESKLAGKFEVKPTEPPRNFKGWASWPRSRSIVNGKDIGVFNRDAVFPHSHVRVVDEGRLNCFKIVTVMVAQFRYNPVTKTLYKVEKGTLKVDFQADPAYSVRRSETRIPLEVKARLKRMVLNYNEFMAQYNSDYTFIEDKILAILIPNDDKDKLTNFDAFVAAKEQHTRFKVQVVTDDDWGGGTGETAYENIRKWLQDNLQKKGLNYALLIGESDISDSKLPMHYFADYANWGPNYADEHDHCETDWAYCQLTGDFKSDRIPELHVGRIPIYDNHSTVDDILQKTIDYFTAEKSEIEWRYNALLGGPGYGSGSTSWKALNPAYHEYIEPMEPAWSAFRCYANNYGTPEEADLVAKTIAPTWAEGSYSIISWGAHGYSTGASSTISSSNTTTIGNDYPGFAMCGSCSNASISNSNNLSYAILKNCGMGAIGGTDYTVISGDMRWIKLFVGHLAVDSLTIGATHTVLIENCSSGWLNRAPYVLYGAPSVGVYTHSNPSEISNFTKTKGDGVQLYAKAISGRSVRFYFNGINQAPASLSIYSVDGSRINTIAIRPGSRSLTWKCVNTAGKRAGNGIYIADLTVNTANVSTVTARAKFVVK